MSVELDHVRATPPPPRHRLSILLLDDRLNQTGDSTVRLLESLGLFSVVPVDSDDMAVSELNQRVFDLALLDVNLGARQEFGGLEVLVECWPRLQETGTRVLVYSQEGYAKRALHAFEQRIGPFRFVPKDDASDPELGREEEASALLKAAVEQLEVRAEELLRQVGLRQRREAHTGQSDSVFVNGRTLNIRSLLSGLVAKYPAREREERMARLARTAFVETDRCRVMSYLFKGCAYSWPAAQMYGLSRLQTYGRLTIPTSSLDPLTHDSIPTPPRTADVYREAYSLASNNARADLSQLSGVRADFMNRWTDYIDIAETWDTWGEEQKGAELMKTKHQFRLSDVVASFKDRGFNVRLVGALEDRFLALRSRKLYNEVVGGQSVVLHGLNCLAESCQSVADRDGDGRKEVVMRIVGDPVGQPIDPAAGTLPILEIGIAHNAPPFENESDITRSFEPGHNRDQAREALVGYASWWTNDASGQVHEILSGDSDPSPHDLRLEGELNPAEWKVINLVRLGIPRFRP